MQDRKVDQVISDAVYENFNSRGRLLIPKKILDYDWDTTVIRALAICQINNDSSLNSAKIGMEKLLEKNAQNQERAVTRDNSSLIVLVFNLILFACLCSATYFTRTRVTIVGCPF